jgi:hypothetical protein
MGSLLFIGLLLLTPAFATSVDYSTTNSTSTHTKPPVTIALPGTTSDAPNANATTPEPTLYGLTGVGFAGLVWMAFRRKKQATN